MPSIICCKRCLKCGRVSSSEILWLQAVIQQSVADVRAQDIHMRPCVLVAGGMISRRMVCWACGPWLSTGSGVILHGTDCSTEN